ncbi:MAG: pyridoxal phosphate-dependent aminotransferase [Candidatus Omnitrophica bacterium]|nr:pyridoxal phosphate-dependent aminotransferase [Candidatus Omnitrophota bacterium]
MNLAKRIQKVNPSLTLAIEAKAKRLKQEGVDLISFSAGEPDFDTPGIIKQAAIDSLEKGFTKYTPASGTLELRKAISEKLTRDNQLSYAPEQIVVSCGAKHALYNVIQTLIGEGDEVIILSPYWLSYPEMVTLAGGRSVILQTKLEDGYCPSVPALEKRVTPKTKLLILNSPSNPTGAVIPKELLEKIAQIAKQRSFFILSDEIYEKLIFDGKTHCSIGSLDEQTLAQTITVGGASKAYAMTGWRLGFSASPKPIAEACASLQSHSTSNPTSFAQAGYLEALKSAEAEVINMRSAFEKRRDLMFRLVSGIRGLKAFKPSGAFYLFINISETRLTSLQFSERLLDEAKVAVVPGIAFGDDHAIRASFATSEPLIEAGVARIREWLKKI